MDKLWKWHNYGCLMSRIVHKLRISAPSTASQNEATWETKSPICIIRTIYLWRPSICWTCLISTSVCSIILQKYLIFMRRTF